MNNETLAKRFIEGSIKGKGSNMFIDGDSIYSYGYHFRIAKRIEHKGFKIYAFNPDGYSVSTAKHKNYVLGELQRTGNKILFVKNADLDYIKEQFKDNLKEVENLKGKLSRARAEHIKESYKRNIQFLGEQNSLFNSYIDGDLYKILTTDLLVGEC